MLDAKGNFRGVAAEEIAQECDIEIKEEELIDLTELAYGDTWRGMLPSAGGCDEFIRLYCLRRTVEPSMLKELEGRLTGLREEGERIKLSIVPLADAFTGAICKPWASIDTRRSSASMDIRPPQPQPIPMLSPACCKSSIGSRYTAMRTMRSGKTITQPTAVAIIWLRDKPSPGGWFTVPPPGRPQVALLAAANPTFLLTRS